MTVTGLGGSGKTRLALEVARSLADAYGGALWFVPLADLSQAELISGAMVDALGIPRSIEEPMERIVAALSRQPSLLVLDNCEHLIDGVADVIQTLLSRLPSLTILATSRQRLNLPGEREFSVPPLTVPKGGETLAQLSLFDSVALFVDRSQSAMPHFQVTSHNAPAVAELCQRLEGIPLAIELAASRAMIFTPAQMLEQLSHRFDLLVTRQRGVTERHRSLEAAIEWSYRLLTLDVQQFFCLLSVFRGGWTTEAAEGVCEEPLARDYLAQLRHCSLILTEQTNEGVRFGMLETLREYGNAQIDKQANALVQRRHADFFVQLAEKINQQLMTGKQGECLTYLDLEHDNFRAALRWCSQEAGAATVGLRLAGSLRRFWDSRGFVNEGRQWLEETLACSGAEEPTLARARALSEAGTLAFSQADYHAARALEEQALLINRSLGDLKGIAISLHHLGDIAQHEGDFAAACTYYDEAWLINSDNNFKIRAAADIVSLGAVARQLGDYSRAEARFQLGLKIYEECNSRIGTASVTLNIGMLAVLMENFDKAQSSYERGLLICREFGNQHLEAITLNMMGELAQKQNDLMGADQYLSLALTLFRKCGLQNWEAINLQNQGIVAQKRGDSVTARTFLGQALRLQSKNNIKKDLPDTLDCFISLALQEGRLVRAFTLDGCSSKLRSEMGFSSPHSSSQRTGIESARKTVDADVFTAALEAGRAMTWEQTIAFALDQMEP